jgi:hypothetical protein
VTAGKPPLRPETLYYAYGVPQEVSRGIEVFDLGSGQDLTAALQLRERDPTITAELVTTPIRLRCRADQADLVGAPAGQGSDDARYGRVGVIDATTGQVLYLTNRARCRAAVH